MKSFCKTILVAISIIATSSLFVSNAYNLFPIYGTVYDEVGDTIIGCGVICETCPNHPGVLTDLDGKYYLQGNHQGHTIKYHAFCYDIEYVTAGRSQIDVTLYLIDDYFEE